MYLCRVSEEQMRYCFSESSPIISFDGVRHLGGRNVDGASDEPPDVEGGGGGCAGCGGSGCGGGESIGVDGG